MCCTVSCCLLIYLRNYTLSEYMIKKQANVHVHTFLLCTFTVQQKSIVLANSLFVLIRCLHYLTDTYQNWWGVLMPLSRVE